MLFLFCNCNAQQENKKANLEEAKKAISESNTLYFQAFAKGNSTIFIDRYTEDCWIMPANTPTLCGVDAPLDFFEQAYTTAGVRNGNFITTEIYSIAAGMVTEAGLFLLFDGNKLMIDEGKYLVLWKKTPNGWKMFRDSFSSNRHSLNF